MPMPRLLDSKKHNYIKKQWNQHRKFGNVDASYADLLNKLSSERGKTRYLDIEFSPMEKESKKLLQTARKMFEDVKAQSPLETRNIKNSIKNL